MSKGTGSEMVRELRALEVLEKEPEIKQAELAARVGVAVGTVNWLLKRLAGKGYVKVKRIGQWRWRYLLTPQGVAEKARLTHEYVQSSLQLYRQTRQEAQRLLSEVRETGRTRVRLEGDRENALVDICHLTCLEQGIKIVSLEESGKPSTANHETSTMNPMNPANPTNPCPVQSRPSRLLHGATNSMNHDDIPILRVVGQEIILEWPKEITHG